MTRTVIRFCGTFQTKLIHSIINRKALCGKSLRQMNAVNVVIRITKVIRGGNKAIIHRKFDEFLNEIDY